METVHSRLDFAGLARWNDACGYAGPMTYVRFAPGDKVRLVRPQLYEGILVRDQLTIGEVYTVEEPQRHMSHLKRPHVPAGGRWVEESCFDLVGDSVLDQIREYEQAAVEAAIRSIQTRQLI